MGRAGQRESLMNLREQIPSTRILVSPIAVATRIVLSALLFPAVNVTETNAPDSAEIRFDGIGVAFVKVRGRSVDPSSGTSRELFC